MKPSHSIGAFQAPTRGDFASNVGLGWLDTAVTKRSRVQTAVVTLDEKDRDPGAVHRLCHWRARKLESCCSISAPKRRLSQYGFGASAPLCLSPYLSANHEHVFLASWWGRSRGPWPPSIWRQLDRNERHPTMPLAAALLVLERFPRDH
jgi:hypothetical protein